MAVERGDGEYLVREEILHALGFASVLDRGFRINRLFFFFLFFCFCFLLFFLCRSFLLFFLLLGWSFLFSRGFFYFLLLSRGIFLLLGLVLRYLFLWSLLRFLLSLCSPTLATLTLKTIAHRTNSPNPTLKQSIKPSPTGFLKSDIHNTDSPMIRNPSFLTRQSHACTMHVVRRNLLQLLRARSGTALVAWQIINLQNLIAKVLDRLKPQGIGAYKKPKRLPNLHLQVPLAATLETLNLGRNIQPLE